MYLLCKTMKTRSYLYYFRILNNTALFYVSFVSAEFCEVSGKSRKLEKLDDNILSLHLVKNTCLLCYAELVLNHE